MTKLLLLALAGLVAGKHHHKDQHAYHKGPHGMSWKDAKQYCDSKDMILATIHNNSEQLAAWEACGGENCWLGLSRDKDDKDIWIWEDKIDYDPITVYWRIGEPNNYNNSEGCAYMWQKDDLNSSPNGVWNDIDCESTELMGNDIVPLCRKEDICIPNCSTPSQCNGASDGCGGWCSSECPMYVKGPVMKWNAARQWCQARGSTLATIWNKEEQHMAQKACGGNNCWIGLNDQIVEGDWRWVDDAETVLDDEMSYWNTGEPNNWQAPEDCAIIWMDDLNILHIPHKGHWADANCGYPMHTLCRNMDQDYPPEDEESDMLDVEIDLGGIEGMPRLNMVMGRLLGLSKPGNDDV